MLKKILIACAILIAGFAVWINSKPDDFHVERTLVMAAPASEIYGHVYSLKKWAAWSPWSKMDPNAKESFEGPNAGKGSVMCWDGNNKVGKGCMTITDTKLNKSVQYRLDFEKPFKDTSNSAFTLTPQGETATSVTWSMSGKATFFSKFMSLFMDCDKMVGGEFEKGLASIKSIVEA